MRPSSWRQQIQQPERATWPSRQQLGILGRAQQNEKATNGLHAGVVGVPATFAETVPTNQRKTMTDARKTKVCHHEETKMAA
jgi:hypothetical protein